MGSDVILKGVENGRNFLESTAVVFWRLVLIPGLIVCLAAVSAWGDFKGYDSDLSNPAVLIDINSQTGLGSIPPELASCNFSPPNTVFSVGFTSGFAYMNNTLYGLKWDGTDIFLYTMSSSTGCAIGAQVGSQPVGFTNLESLVYVPGDGVFYSVDFNFAAHTGRLIRIDPVTGLGTVVGGSMSLDVKVGGLAYEPVTDVLYAVTLSNATRRVELLTINRTTGAETLIGATGTADESLQSLGIDSSVTPAKLFAAGTMLYELNRSTGAATLVGGNYTGTVWAMASPEATSPPPAVDPIPDITANGSDGPVTPTDNLLVTVALDPGSRSGDDADWWAAANVSGTSIIDGWYYFDLNASEFVFAGASYTDLLVTYQGPLFDLTPPFQILNIPASGLPSGIYTFYLAVDMNRNGVLDFVELFFDSVTVTVP